MANIQDYLNGYTRNPIPNIGLSNSQVVFPTAALSTYNPQVPDYKLAAQSSQIAENRRYKAAESSAGIDAIFSTLGQQLHQDAETASWFEGFKNKYKGEVDNYLLSGDYGNAIFYAKQAAAKAAQDPELLARIKTNKQYESDKKVADDMLAKGMINKDIYDRWAEENQYKFNPIKNDLGEVIGGQDYKSNWMPVEQQDLTDFYAELQRVVTRKQGSGESIVFLDANGKETTDPTKNVWGMVKKVGTEYVHLNHNDLVEAFKELYDANPKLKAALEQEHDTLLWKYKKLSDDEKQAQYGSDIVDEQGITRSLDEYITHKVTPDLYRYQIHRVDNKIAYGDAYKNYNEAATARKQASFILDTSIGAGPTIQVDYSKNISHSFENGVDAISDIENIYLNPKANYYSKTKAWLNDSRYRDAKRRGDFLAAANFLERHLVDSPEVKNKIRVLKQQGKLMNSIVDGLNEEEKDVVLTYAALNSNLNLVNPSQKGWAGKVNKIKNKLFSYNITGKNVPTNSFGLQFANNNELFDFIKELKINQNDLMHYGLTIRNENGIALEVDKNSPLLQQIANTNNKFNANIINWDDKGRIINKHNKLIKTPISSEFEDFSNVNFNYGDIMVGNKNYKSPYRNTKTELYELSDEGIIGDLHEKVIDVLNRKKLGQVQTNMTSTYSDFNVRAVFETVGKPGGMNIEIANKYANDLDKENYNTALLALSQTGNEFPIYAKENGVYTLLSEKDNLAAKNELINALSDDKVTMRGIINPDPNDKTGYGSAITIKAIVDNNGKEVRPAKTYIVGGLLHNQAAVSVANSPVTSNFQLYNLYRSNNSPIQDIDGRNIDYNDPNGFKKFSASESMNNALNTLSVYAEQGKAVSDEEIEAVAAGILNEQGLNADDSNYKTKLKIVYNKLKNHYNNSK